MTSLHLLVAIYSCIVIVFFPLSGKGDATVDPIVIKGTHFFYKTNGTAFVLRGMHYQPFNNTDDTSDPLEREEICQRDIPFLKALRINTINILLINPHVDHSACMNALANAGIYVLAGLGLPDLSVDTGSLLWNQTIFDRFTGVIDSIARFSNTLGFFVTEAADFFDTRNEGIPFIKAAVRDVKAYIDQRQYRRIPIGWYHSIEASNQTDYMVCDDTKIDFLAFYEDSSENCTTLAEIEAMKEYSNTLSIPNFGQSVYCRAAVDGRKFDFIPEIFSEEALESLNGALIDQYIQHGGADDAGLVRIISGNNDESSISTLDGYKALSSAMGSAEPTFSNAADYAPTTSFPACPSESGFNILPPRPYEPLCSCVMETLNCTATGKLDFDFNETIVAVCEDDLSSNCAGIYKSPTEGKYGAFSMCNSTVVYSWAANQYHKRHGTCDRNGTIRLQAPTPPRFSDCIFLLDQVGENGEKTVTSYPAPATAAPRSTPTLTRDGERTLSTGAKAGIAVGTIFGVAAIASFLVVYLHNRRIRMVKEATSKGQGDLPEYIPPKNKVQNGQNLSPVTLPVKQSAALSANPQQPVELSENPREPAELPEAQSLIRS